jgi:hypothetical protein
LVAIHAAQQAGRASALPTAGQWAEEIAWAVRKTLEHASAEPAAAEG